MKVADIVIASMFTLSLLLFMEPLIGCLTILATAAVTALRIKDRGLYVRALTAASIFLPLTSITLLWVSIMMKCAQFLLASLMAGYASPAPLIPVVTRCLRIGTSKQVILSILLLTLGIATLPAYGVEPLSILNSLNGLSTITEAGLYFIVYYAPSTVAILLSYILMMYTVLSRLRLIL